MREARYYKPTDGTTVQCELCPHGCTIADGRTGICRVRRNEGGKLYSTIYGEVTSVCVDPIEKKPLYHFFPGSQILSIGTNGCNFRCLYCQNWQISQKDTARRKLDSESLVELSKREGSIGIAYTYNEPLIWFEFVIDTARLVRQAGQVNVLVTNGYINAEPLGELLPLVDALNIDVKSMRPDFYKRLCGGSLEPVLETCKSAAAEAHVEITNLVIPGENDTREDFMKLADWVAGNLGRQTPLHLSAYYPRHKLNAPPTSHEKLQEAYRTCKERLDHVYIGNVRGAEGQNSFCRSCGALLVRREGYRTSASGLVDGRCKACGTENGFRMN